MSIDPPSADPIVDVALRGVGVTIPTNRRLRSIFLNNKINRIPYFVIRHSSLNYLIPGFDFSGK